MTEQAFPETEWRSAPSKSAVQDALNEAALHWLSVGTTGAALLFGFYAAANMVYYTDWMSATLGATAAAAAVGMFALRLLIGMRLVATRWANLLGGAVVLLALADVAVGMYLLPAPQHTTDFMLVALAAGFLFVSGRWLTAMLATIVAVWAVLAWSAPPSGDWKHYCYSMVSVCVLAGIIHRSRVHTLRHLETLRLADQALHVELQNALASAQREIVERNRAEESLRESQRRLQESQKLESLGVLAGGVAHDFNNLLTGIVGNASLAQAELGAAAPAMEYLEQITIASQRASELCNQMLAYSGKGRFVVRRLDLSVLVQETTHLLQVSISKKVTLRCRLADGLPAVEADDTQIRQIVMNLVMNATDAIGDRPGLISIATGVMHADAAYFAQTVLTPQLPAGSYVYLEVSDDGCGMTHETLARIFEPFFTTKFTGRGLGLAAVLGIVRGHKGALKVYSEPGRGSVFRLLLPAAAGRFESTTPEEVASHRWRGSGTVLVVDDEPMVRDVLARMLHSLGFQALLAQDGIEAVAHYETLAEQISLVFLDLTMPRLDGEETFRELRRIRPDARVIVISGFSEQDAGDRFVGKRKVGFIQKPFRIEDLSNKLQAVLSENGDW